MFPVKTNWHQVKPTFNQFFVGQSIRLVASLFDQLNTLSWSFDLAASYCETRTHFTTTIQRNLISNTEPLCPSITTDIIYSETMETKRWCLNICLHCTLSFYVNCFSMLKSSGVNKDAWSVSLFVLQVEDESDSPVVLFKFNQEESTGKTFMLSKCKNKSEVLLKTKDKIRQYLRQLNNYETWAQEGKYCQPMTWAASVWKLHSINQQAFQGHLWRMWMCNVVWKLWFKKKFSSPPISKDIKVLKSLRMMNGLSFLGNGAFRHHFFYLLV